MNDMPIAPALDMNIAHDVHVRAAFSVLSQLDKVCAEVQNHYAWMEGINVPGYKESGNIENLLFSATDEATKWLGEAVFRAGHDGAITGPAKVEPPNTGDILGHGPDDCGGCSSHKSMCCCDDMSGETN